MIAEADSLLQLALMLLAMPSSAAGLAPSAAQAPFLSARERPANRHVHQIKIFYLRPLPLTLYPPALVAELLVLGPIRDSILIAETNPFQFVAPLSLLILNPSFLP